jgi:hypothetical protein
VVPQGGVCGSDRAARHRGVRADFYRRLSPRLPTQGVRAKVSHAKRGRWSNRLAPLPEAGGPQGPTRGVKFLSVNRDCSLDRFGPTAVSVKLSGTIIWNHWDWGAFRSLRTLALREAGRDASASNHSGTTNFPPPSPQAALAPHAPRLLRQVGGLQTPADNCLGRMLHEHCGLQSHCPQ